jgi:CRISPR-associated endonuclease/helicase Cas3
LPFSFELFFKCAIGPDKIPYPYQCRLALEPWPGILTVPTGMGKTAATILAWLYKRICRDPDTPRRLVYCLPMRVLVDQVSQNAQEWISNLVSHGLIESDNQPTVSVIMGGEIDSSWEAFPERPSIIIGTQDQLLSRALNRGYAMSRFKWPVHFALLNNDCLWVLDEVQLMGSGLTTTTQLQAFREQMGTFYPARSLWMSATMRRDWLQTIDFVDGGNRLSELNLSDKDRARPQVSARYHAIKKLEEIRSDPTDFKTLAKRVISLHKPGKRTLIVLNTVDRAVRLYQGLVAKNPDAVLTLLHSRFRPPDRKNNLDKLLSEPNSQGTICVATQVVEAGVDVSATTLITDLAPWASLVQRFGRCNRNGLEESSCVYWITLDIRKKELALPYTPDELQHSVNVLEKLEQVGPASLPPLDIKMEPDRVLRRKDIIELFDTTPNLAGLDSDVSTFIRETDDHDLQVFWRDLPAAGPKPGEPGAHRNELCSVPVYKLRDLTKLAIWRWDHLEQEWTKPEALGPGMILMLRKSDGCYGLDVGWTGNSEDVPTVSNLQGAQEEGLGDDGFSFSAWQTLLAHNTNVMGELQKLLKDCPLPGELQGVLKIAAAYHDIGKAHKTFQQSMLGNPPEADSREVWAKTARKSIHHTRPGFRHELASALAMLQHGLPDLAAYLAASHHGKVRLSIRSLPFEKAPPDPNLRYARGVWDRDSLPEIQVTGSITLPLTELDLSYMELGEGSRGPSWLARMLALRDDPNIGIFRLAFLETLLRVADWRGSQKDAQQNV